MSPRGGPRKGAGRPPGTGTGRTVRAVNVTIPPDLLEEIADAVDPGESRSAFVCAAVRGEIQQRAKARGEDSGR